MCPLQFTGNSFLDAHRGGTSPKRMPMCFPTLHLGSQNKSCPNENSLHVEHGFTEINRNQVEHSSVQTSLVDCGYDYTTLYIYLMPLHWIDLRLLSYPNPKVKLLIMNILRPLILMSESYSKMFVPLSTPTNHTGDAVSLKHASTEYVHFPIFAI